VRTALFHHHCPLLLVRAAPVLTDAHNTSLRALPPRAPPLFIWWLKHGSYNTGSHTSQNQLGCRRHRRQYLRYCTQPPPQCPHPKAQRAKTKPAMKPAKGPTSNLSVNICSAVLLRDTNVTMFTNEGHKLYTNNRTTKAVDKRYSVELRRVLTLGSPHSRVLQTSIWPPKGLLAVQRRRERKRCALPAPSPSAAYVPSAPDWPVRTLPAHAHLSVPRPAAQWLGTKASG
jgi:hypothetical protein